MTDEGLPPTQNDYAVGRSCTELVPEALRVYRHFKVNEFYQLTPTTQGVEPFKYGWNEARCLAPDYANAYRSCLDCGGTGRVVFHSGNGDGPQYNGAGRFFATGLPEISYTVCQCVAQCSVPNVRCKCGYYASYDPDTDFFADFIRQMTAGGPGWYPDLPPVFGVVEVAGRVLMGSKGVRAQRMRIVALALDENHLTLNRRLQYTTFALKKSRSTDVDHFLMAIRGLGARYDIPTFGLDMNEMIINFPKPDLSQLIENQE